MGSEQAKTERVVAVIGAGPAGLYAAKKLSSQGVGVILINRDIKPGGLAEYGIYPTKHKMKEGLRKQFRKVLAADNLRYFGNVSVGAQGDLKLEDIEAMGFPAVLFTIGAQGTRKLGLDGEDALEGVFHAKDLVYHFNQLPPFASQEFAVGKRVGIIGMGNVMVDIAHWLVREKKVEEVTVIARRGPAERAYTDKEMREIALALDLDDLKEELARIGPRLKAIGQDPDQLYEELCKPLAKAKPLESPTRVRFRFLCTSRQLHGDENKRVSHLEVEHNELVPRGDSFRPNPTGERDKLAMDTLVYAIGDQVDETVGLPFEWGKYTVPPEPHERVEDRARYEVYDAEDGIREGWFLGGWARIASDGLVGKARADGETAVEEVMHYLEEKQPASKSLEEYAAALMEKLAEHSVIHKEDVQLLEAAEGEEAKSRGVDFHKFNTNTEMLEIIEQKKSEG